MKRWIKLANSITLFLSTLYAAQKKSGTERPEKFDSACLMVRYKNEYGMPELHTFIGNIFMPLTNSFGKMLVKYKKFK